MSSVPVNPIRAREVETLAAELHAAGFLVTRDAAVEPAAIDAKLGVTRAMLRRWRSELLGPPARKHGRLVLYPLAEYLDWSHEQRARR